MSLKFKTYTYGNNRYLVYTNGSVYTTTRKHWLTKFKHPNGYLRVSFWNKGKVENWLIHRLVATLFIPNPNNLAEVNHKDGDKENNHISNLEWMTRAENAKHAKDTGLFQPVRDRAIARHDSWLGMKNSSREVIALTDIEKNGNYKVKVRCNCSNEFLMYFNDFKKDKLQYCIKCRPISSYRP